MGLYLPTQAPEHNVELASVERTDAVTLTGTSIQDVPGMSITFEVTNRPVYVYFGCSNLRHSVADTVCILYLRYANNDFITFMMGTSAVALARVPLGASQARINTPGIKTVKLSVQGGAAGTLDAGVTVNSPMFLRAVEV